MDRILADPRVACPGDPDLDAYLSGLLIRWWTALPYGAGAEFIVSFDTTLATGWWRQRDGSVFKPDTITEAASYFGFTGPEQAERAVWQLTAWEVTGAMLAKTCAPGKRTLITSDQAGQMLIYPRFMPGGEAAHAPGEARP